MAREPIEIAFERRGDGSPLVLLHGIGHRWQAWAPVLDALSAEHDVIAVDLPGFGASPLLPEGRGYDMPNAVQACADIFADLGLGRPHVAGNSLGGAISLELASRGLVSSATALAPAGFWNARDRAWALRALTMIRSSGRTPAWLRAAFVRNRYFRMAAGSMLYGHPSRMTAETMLADLLSMVGARGFDLVAEAGREYTFAAPEPTVPVAVGWGTRDRILWPRQARRAAALLPKARHVWLYRAGHVPMIDEPAQVASLILATCAAAAADRAA
ncbi:alpha/beta fold hydrolase [Actinophytocola sp.]|jgi:pimeloyl-ACP methyl ester carboxylesterase|uniref:alpha/beta fold hydrolase n=1 Tax=Actinophytocola sp. TaxID=1872138 RepID=UPI002D34624C|nr:alpha/beta fold hydrolase [Actinophytocola sp.]HYQ62305.1 alpha/beta fold hydrolase [Actinophytocola sp.]